MGVRLNWKKVLLIAWAVVLSFGISYELAVAAAAHNQCARTCKRSCGGSGCATYDQQGCSCNYLCNDGTEGSTICVE